jgi:2-amino-4-hydroxy-6-hydroxymethyldihydropteridine diphosphokinase
VTLAAIGLGSNIDGGRALAPARRALHALERTVILRCSSWYGSAPWGGAQGGCFVNGAILVDTGLAPGVLLAELRRIEQALGRRRGPRYGRRVVDLDLLCMEGVRLATPRLVLPHPQLCERRFVLQPLCEIAPEQVVAPGLRAVAALARCPDRGRLWRVALPGHLDAGARAEAWRRRVVGAAR